MMTDGRISAASKVLDDQGAIDVEKLLRLARDKSVAGRTALADIVGDLFFGHSGTLSDEERSLMTDILRQLVQDVEIRVRKHLAIRLSDCADAPYDLVIALANDEAEVAYPILLKSRILRDHDLIEIIHHRTLEHQLAIAMRDSLTGTVCAALVDTGRETVIKRLLENPNAEIARDTMAYLVEQSRRLNGLQEPLLSRSDLPAELARRMYWWVSAALRAHIIEHFDVDATEIDSAMEEVVGTIIDAEQAEPVAPSPTDRVAAHLAQAGPADGGLMLRLLREGEISLFERVVERQTGLRRSLLQRLLYEPGGEGLAIICRAMQLEAETFEEILFLTRKARVGLDENDVEECAFARACYRQIPLEAAQQILARWRRNPDYLDLLRQLEELPGIGAQPDYLRRHSA